jgi:ABC-type multidrug transport system ATPase subunit
MITLNNVSKQYKAGKVIINPISREFSNGKAIALVGPNGSGKTTFLRMLSVNTYPTTGTVLFKNTDIHKNPVSYLSHTGLVHDDDALPQYMSAAELLEWILRSRKKWDNQQSPVQISEMLDTLSLFEEREERIGTYSTGMRKKTQVAAAMITGPDVLILDEPLRGLDAEARKTVWKLLNQAKSDGVLIFMASHTGEEGAELFDEVLTFPLR